MIAFLTKEDNKVNKLLTNNTVSFDSFMVFLYQVQ